MKKNLKNPIKSTALSSYFAHICVGWQRQQLEFGELGMQ